MLFLNQVSSDKKIIDTKCGIAQVEFEKQEIASRYRAWISSLDDDDNRVVLSLYVPSFMKLDKPLETNSLIGMMVHGFPVAQQFVEDMIHANQTIETMKIAMDERLGRGLTPPTKRVSIIMTNYFRQKALTKKSSYTAAYVAWLRQSQIHCIWQNIADAL